ncbi:HpcH/HpaI aldolase/citrate lyase family protein [Microbacterium sp. 18062]|uniref:HpcH/HpaI aldolase family protein n=1 Tax=Microbacterium sp. 18062 TaxID=2681410 RepID=UPI0013573F13|nr:aldolase/citrate lyase family protein [Microbacterium sp. 18062]
MADPVNRGIWMLGTDPGAARTIAVAGIDWIAFDLQHGRIDDARMHDLLLATAGTVPRWVRVGAADAARIGRALDSGADGILAPQVSSRDEAEAVVRGALYPPDGARSWGPLAGYGAKAVPATPRVGVMIESEAGLRAVDEIAAVPGIDLVFVGPFDLALSLGTTVEDLLDAADDPASPLARIRDAARAVGVRLGAFAGTPRSARRFARIGYRQLTVATDILLLTEGVERVTADSGALRAPAEDAE